METRLCTVLLVGALSACNAQPPGEICAPPTTPQQLPALKVETAPSGCRIAYLEWLPVSDQGGHEPGSVVLSSLDLRERQVVAVRGTWNAVRFAPDGSLVYLVDTGFGFRLMVRPDEGRGAPRFVADHVASFTLSEDGRGLVYVVGSPILGPESAEIWSAPVDGGAPPVKLADEGQIIASRPPDVWPAIYLVEGPNVAGRCLGAYGRVSRLSADGRATAFIAEPAGFAAASASGRLVTFSIDADGNRIYSARFPNEVREPRRLLTLGPETYSRCGTCGCDGDWAVFRFTPDGSGLSLRRGWSGGDYGNEEPTLHLYDLDGPGPRPPVVVPCADDYAVWTAASDQGPLCADGDLALLTFDGARVVIDTEVDPQIESIDWHRWLYQRGGTVRLLDTERDASTSAFFDGYVLFRGIIRNRWVVLADQPEYSLPPETRYFLGDLLTGQVRATPYRPSDVTADGRAVLYGEMSLLGPVQ